MSDELYFPDKSIQQLIDLLENGDYRERHWSVMDLKTHVAQAAIPNLGDALLNDPEPDIRFHAALALGAMEDASALPYLIDAADDEIPSIRQNIATSIGFLLAEDEENDAALNVLFWLLNDDDEDVMHYAAAAMGRAGTSVLQPLLDGLRDDGLEDRHKVGIIWALSSLSDRMDVAPYLFEALDMSTRLVQEAIVHKLSMSPEEFGERIIQPLLPFLDDPDMNVRESARHALMRVGYDVP